jgi:hypothetical protein
LLASRLGFWLAVEVDCMEEKAEAGQPVEAEWRA